MSVKGEKPKYQGIPAGYICTDKGVKLTNDEGSDIQITAKPVIVKAATRDENSENHGLYIWWKDVDDKEHTAALPKRLIHSPGYEAALQLIDGGLPVTQGQEKSLLRYLSVFQAKNRLIAATCTGWLGEAFVLPNEVINQPKGVQIVYQPPGGIKAAAKAIHRQGDFDTWKAGMAGASATVIFKVCFSLSAPIRFKVNIEAGGFHLYTSTTQGKTTVLQAAASVWGNGSDPQVSGGEAYIQRWNSTMNALEATAEVLNDIYFPIDEVGEGDSRVFGQAIYRLFSGVGKSRAQITGDLRQNKSWRVTVGSAGEIAVSDFISAGGGKVKGGQLVRLADLDIASVGDLFADGPEADAMKKLCSNHFGHAGPEMLLNLPDIEKGWDEFDQAIVGEAIVPEATRVRKRFALTAFVGMKAADAGIVPWTAEEVLEAVQRVYQVWHHQINTLSDLDRGVKSVVDFILQHASRFDAGISDFPPRDRVGWLRDNIYHFSDNGFKEACNGGDPAKIRKALKELGYLHFSHGYKTRITVNRQKVLVTSVKAEILGGHIGHIHETGMCPAETLTDKGTDTRDTPDTSKNSANKINADTCSDSLQQQKSDVSGVSDVSSPTSTRAELGHMAESEMCPVCPEPVIQGKWVETPDNEIFEGK